MAASQKRLDLQKQQLAASASSREASKAKVASSTSTVIKAASSPLPSLFTSSVSTPKTPLPASPSTQPTKTTSGATSLANTFGNGIGQPRVTNATGSPTNSISLPATPTPVIDNSPQEVSPDVNNPWPAVLPRAKSSLTGSEQSQGATQPGDVTLGDVDEANKQKDSDLKAVEALKNSSLFAEGEVRDSLTQLADDTFARQQKILADAQALYDQALANRNAAIESTSEVERRDAETAFQASKFELDQQRLRSEKAYNDQLAEQRTNNLSRVLQKESLVAALGGFGSLWANKEIEDLTLENDRILNDIYFEKDDADRETSFNITRVNKEYQDQLFRIETEKNNAIQENYDQYMGYVQDVQEKRSLSATERQELIVSATNDYKKNVAQINQNAFTNRYEISQEARNYADTLKAQLRNQVERDKSEAKQNLETAIGFLTSGTEPLLSSDAKKLAELEVAAGLTPGMAERAIRAVKEELKNKNITIETLSDGEDVVYVSIDRSNPQNPVIKEISRLEGLGKLSSELAKEEAKNSFSFGSLGIGNNLVAVSTASPFMGSPYNKDGIDFPGEYGSPITSSTDGEVIFAGDAGGWGNQVRVKDAEGNIHQYSHLSGINVNVGDQVGSGTELGAMGNSGNVLKADGTKPTEEEKAAGRGTHLDYTVYKPDGSKYTVQEAAAFAGYNPGAKEFTEAQKALLSTIDPNKITSTTTKLLADAGLTASDLGEFLATEKKVLSPDKKQDIQDIIRSIDDLKGMSEPLTDAVGASFWKLFMSKEAEAEGLFPAGTQASDFAKEFMSFRDRLVLPSLDKLKGVMSDKDIVFLRNAATSLSLAQSEAQFLKTLDSMREKYEKILNPSYNPYMGTNEETTDFTARTDEELESMTDEELDAYEASLKFKK